MLSCTERSLSKLDVPTQHHMSMSWAGMWIYEAGPRSKGILSLMTSSRIGKAGCHLSLACSIAALVLFSAELASNQLSFIRTSTSAPILFFSSSALPSSRLFFIANAELQVIRLANVCLFVTFQHQHTVPPVCCEGLCSPKTISAYPGVVVERYSNVLAYKQMLLAIMVVQSESPKT